MSTESVLAEVAAERLRQTGKWGLQRPADTGGPGDDVRLLGRTYAFLERTLKNECDRLQPDRQQDRQDRRNMAAIALEEVFEALSAVAAGNTEDARTEMIRCAAMFVKWVETIDYRQAKADRTAYLADPLGWTERNTVDGIRPHIPRDPDQPEPGASELLGSVVDRMSAVHWSLPFPVDATIISVFTEADLGQDVMDALSFGAEDGEEEPGK